MNLSKDLILKHLPKKYRDLPIFIYKTIGSTNTEAKKFAKLENINRAVFIADEQTCGRGRLGRSFSSESGKGLYLSILTEGGTAAEHAVSITTYMAVTAAEVIEELCGINVQIKWVNDLFANGKKLGGILTEGEIGEDGVLKYSVCGIGINILNGSFPDDVVGIATTIEEACGKQIDVNLLAAELIERFLDNLGESRTLKISDMYKSRSFIIGKKIRVIKKNSEYNAYVEDITDKCMLKLRLDDGSVEILSTGEVSIREKN